MSKIPSRRPDGWSWKIRYVGTVLSIILLIWLLIRQDWSAIIGAIGTLSVWYVVASILLIALRHAIHTFRWLLLVTAQGIPLTYSSALKLVYSGLFVSNFLPSMVGGDVVKIAGVVQKTPNRVAAVASVVVDRIVGAIGMLAALPFSAPLVSSFFDSTFVLGASISSMPPRISKFLRASFDHLSSATKLWARQPQRLFFALLTSWMGMFVNFVAIWILAKGLGMSVSFVDVVGASALTYYLTIIPLSINGYGIRELAVVGLYTQLGAAGEQASALALLSRLIYMIVSLPGVVWVGKVLEYERSSENQKPDEGKQ